MSAPGACLRALLWYQGESDCDTEENASLYASRFATFLNAYRQLLSARGYIGPNCLLPVYQVAITTRLIPGLTDFRDQVRACQLSCHLPGVFTVDAAALSPHRLLEDGVHLETSTQVALGQALAHLYLETAEATKSPC